jgi:hypothetical protein
MTDLMQVKIRLGHDGEHRIPVRGGTTHAALNGCAEAESVQALPRRLEPVAEAAFPPAGHGRLAHQLQRLLQHQGVSPVSVHFIQHAYKRAAGEGEPSYFAGVPVCRLVVPQNAANGRLALVLLCCLDLGRLQGTQACNEGGPAQPSPACGGGGGEWAR